jgi:hypothetical protein
MLKPPPSQASNVFFDYYADDKEKDVSDQKGPGR